MKTTGLVLGMVLGMLQLAQAGGNSSIANITVTSIEIEAEKIIIKGNGKLAKRVMSDAEHGDATAFGQPAQMLHARLRECVFEVIPYHHRMGEVKGVPTGQATPKMVEQCKKWWEGTLAKAKEIKVGDRLQIGLQRERMTMVGLEVTYVVGSGSLTVAKPVAGE